MEIKQLRTFMHVATLGKLSLASDRLGTAQPALSRQIRMLEEELGVRLFDRNGRGMIPTDAGELLLAKVGFLVRYMEEVRSEIQSFAGTVRGHVVVGMPEGLAEVIAAKLIDNFVTRYPETSVHFITSKGGRSPISSAECSFPSNVSMLPLRSTSFVVRVSKSTASSKRMPVVK